MNILLFHPDPEVTAMLSFCLESQSENKVYRALDFSSATDFFLSDTSFDLLITSEFSETDKLFKYMLSTGSTIPVILVSEDPKATLKTYPDIRVLGQVKLIDISSHLLPLVKGHFTEIKSPENGSDFCRIQTSLLAKVEALSADVYVRLSNIKFVKLFRSGARFTGDDLENYLNRRKIEFLYVKRQESKEFVEKFNRYLTNLALSAQPEDPQLLATVIDIQDQIHQLSKSLGFKPEIMAMVKSNVQLALKFIGASPSLSKAIQMSALASKNYVSAHSVMLGSISCAISTQMNWHSESTFQKLVMASLFHDFVFENIEHAKINSLAELNLARYAVSEEEFKTIRNHPIKASEVVMTMTEIPADVDTIILQHHERPDGSGFPHGINSNQISPLAAIVIVAHDILDASFEQKDQFNLKRFLIKMDPRYQGIAFRKVWRALASAVPDFQGHSEAA